MRQNKICIRNLGNDYSVETIEKDLLGKDYKKRENKKNTDQFDLLSKRPGSHSKGLLKIINNPEIIGINDHFYHASPEVDFFEKNTQAGSVDVFIETRTNQYIIEYKCNDHKKNREKVSDQLPKGEKYLKIARKLNPNKPCILLYVFGKKPITYEFTENGFNHYYTKE
ncbi:hypothetical protein GW932_03175 [archaeon]|nr:hypothetical protein [archaeon]